MNSLRITILTLFIAVGLAAAPPLYHYSKGNLSAADTALPATAKTDAIMVFTGSADRIKKGYEFYSSGLAKKLMFTGYDYPKQIREAGVKKLLKKVDKDQVYIDLKAANTIENAENGAEWALKNHVKSILLVTTEGHMPRAYFELRRLLPPEVKVYTNAIPGKLKYPGVDSEKGRLLCRLYETATDTEFCYKTRDIIRDLEDHLT